MIGRKFYSKEKLKILKEWWQLGRGANNAKRVARRNNCCLQSIYLWNKKFKGTIESLENSDQTPHHIWNITPQKELNAFKRMCKQYRGMGYMELYGRLQTEKGFTKSIRTLYRMLKKINFAPVQELKKYIPEKYETPKMAGVKWQIDVKYVPIACMAPELVAPYSKSCNSKGLRFYQYTCIDEATRKRFLYIYDSFSKLGTIDFMKRCAIFFGYKPLIVQTDNGREFTNAKEQKKHEFTKFLNEIGVRHQLIRAYCPRHNGKVERSHRTDNQEFYALNIFTSLEDARQKQKDWVYRYNNVRVMSALNYKTPQAVENEMLKKLRGDNTAQYVSKNGLTITGKVCFVKKSEAWAFAPRPVLKLKAAA